MDKLSKHNSLMPIKENELLDLNMFDEIENNEQNVQKEIMHTESRKS